MAEAIRTARIAGDRHFNGRRATKPVPGFMQQFGIDYPVAMGDAKLADQYGGVLGLPVTFVIGRDGQIYHKHVGLTDTALLEAEIKQLLEK